MLIAIAVAAAVLLPVIFLVLSFADRPFVNMAMVEQQDKFIETVERLVVTDNISRARRLCGVLEGDFPLVRGIEEMLAKMPSATRADLEKIADVYGEKAEAAIRERQRFSVRRLVRNVLCFGTPIALTSFGNAGQGWVIGPLTLSLLFMTGLTIVNHLMAAAAIRRLVTVRGALLRCADAYVSANVPARIDVRQGA